MKTFTKNELENKDLFVECEFCGHIIAKGSAQVVDVNGGSSSDFGFTYIRCSQHKLPYDEVNIIFGKTTYYKRMKVDVNGTPLGFTKKKQSS